MCILAGATQLTFTSPPCNWPIRSAARLRTCGDTSTAMNMPPVLDMRDSVSLAEKAPHRPLHY